MDTIFLNSKNSETSYPCELLLNLTDKINLRASEKRVALSNLSKYYTWKNIKSTYKNNEFKILAAIWNDEFDLLNGLYSIPNIQDYFEDIFKKHETLTDDNPPIKIYVDKIENTFKIK